MTARHANRVAIAARRVASTPHSTKEKREAASIAYLTASDIRSMSLINLEKAEADLFAVRAALVKANEDLADLFYNTRHAALAARTAVDITIRG